MTNQEILEKAISKAIDGGWTGLKPSVKETVEIMLNNRLVEAVIFNHRFAKALWTDIRIKDKKYIVPTSESWKLHLQNMVIAPDPIAYLGGNL